MKSQRDHMINNYEEILRLIGDFDLVKVLFTKMF